MQHSIEFPGCRRNPHNWIVVWEEIDRNGMVCECSMGFQTYEQANKFADTLKVESEISEVF